MNILALATVHNRKDKTLSALKSIAEQHLPPGVSIAVVIVDDGSTDGTAAAIRTRYPEVKLIEGDGNLYWAGGMRFGWDVAVKGMEFDALLAFNDDVVFFPDAIGTLCKDYASARNKNASVCVVGSCRAPDGLETTYSGYRRRPRRGPLNVVQLEPNGEIQACHTLNMNAALISRTALEVTDFISTDYRHGMADFDFGYRLGALGGCVLVSSRHVAVCCSDRTVRNTPFDEGLSFKQRWSRLTSVHGQPFGERAAFLKRHGGRFWPFLWPSPYIKLLIFSIRESTKR